MKSRNGFVSNSSSSSFIVAFPKKPTSVIETLNIMFPSSTGEERLDYNEQGMTYLEVADRVFHDIEDQNNDEIVDRYRLLELFRHTVDRENHYYRYSSIISSQSNPEIILIKQRMEAIRIKQDEYKNRIRFQYNIENEQQEKSNSVVSILIRDMDNKCDSEWIMLNRQVNDLITEIAAQRVDEFLKKYHSYKIFNLSYADDSGEGELEHGNIFRNLPHITTSHH